MAEARNKPTDRNAPVESQRGIFSKFLAEIEDPEKKESFLRSLSEEEKIQFCTSQEEFRQIFGREPDDAFPKEKGEFERDVSFSDVKESRIAERFAEVMAMFPQNKSSEGLRNKAKDMERQGPSPLIKSIDDLKKAADISISIDVRT